MIPNKPDQRIRLFLFITEFKYNPILSICQMNIIYLNKYNAILSLHAPSIKNNLISLLTFL